ncbi:FxSxx-COOH system tetratricopeptide repeat protein [Streptomyces sp. NPDC005728]|uniref:FxSxx-COOH system tetratricopeptide repeat protein n=1 Tax=Streptomyces sp. NPDC005728 TaxID=3157054 RepID=UPI0033DD2CC5
MTDSLARLLSAVHALVDDADPVLLADAAWLAAARTSPSHPTNPDAPPPPPPLPSSKPQPPESTATPPPPDPDPSSVSARRPSGGTPVRGVPLSVERPAPLPEALALGRALQPFLKPWPHGLRPRLDIDATIDHYARSGTLLPVFAPSPERWFEIVVVVDTSLTMTLWNDLTQALGRVMHDLGAFRSVHIWPLSWQDGTPRLHDHQGHAVPWRRAPQHSGSPRGRRLLLVLTDCAAPGWRQQKPWRMLRTWARSAPLALINPLPRRLWHRSALNHPPCQAVAPYPAAPTSTLRPTPRRPANPDVAEQALPVLTCTPHALRAWARTVMRADPNGCEAVLVPAENHPPQNRQGDDNFAPSTLADAFLRTAPPAAARLTVLVSLLDSFTVPMLKVLRERAMPTTGLSDVAEVLTCGLLTVSHQDGQDPVLTFDPDARRRLQEELTRRDLRLVHQAMNAHLADHPYAPHGIQAVLHTGDAPHDLPADLTPFAQASASTLRLLGINSTHRESGTAPDTADSTTAAQPAAAPETSAPLTTTAEEALEPTAEQEVSDRQAPAPDRGGGLLRRMWRNLSGRESPPPQAQHVDAKSIAYVTADASGAITASTIHQVTLHPYTAREPAPWPHQVGIIPSSARSFQHRAASERLRAAIDRGGTALLSPVLTGMGGVGKTQLAAEYARSAWADGGLDVLVWVTAGTRPAVVSSYAQAGVELCRANPDDPEQAAVGFLAFLEPKAGARPCRWLIVLDDVTDPNDLQGFWPPASPYGRTLVTTRRRDVMLTADSRHLIEVDLFTQDEALAYLTQSLAAHGRSEPAEGLADLAHELGHLPLALAQAAAYLIDSGQDVATYHRMLVDRATRLIDATPDYFHGDGALPLAATWSLSIDHADQLRPHGLPRPMLQLAAMLDANEIPEAVLTSLPVLTYLAAHRSPDGQSRTAPYSPVSPSDAVQALRALHRVSLIDHSPTYPPTVRIHGLVQRATRDTLGTSQFDRLARTAADALMAAWPEVERDTTFAQALRTNTDALIRHAESALYRPDAHQVLYQAGKSLGQSGQFNAARYYFEHLASATHQYLGFDHPDTLAARQYLAHWRGEAGDVRGASDAFAELLADRLRVLGPDHPDTLGARHGLALWRGEAGDAAGAEAAFAELLADRLRVLGPDHPDTLAARQYLAHWRGEAGDAAGAEAAFAELLADRLRVLGPDHPDTLAARHGLALWRGEAGDAAGAAAAVEELLGDRLRVLGPDHLDTLAARHSLARWQGESGDAAGATAAFETLLADRLRVLGPDHPDTLAARHSLARWQGESGDAAGATAAFETLLADRLRVLGPDHPDTLTARRNLARWRGEAGDAAGAANAFAELLADMVRVLGPDHPTVIVARGDLLRWRERSGTP